MSGPTPAPGDPARPARPRSTSQQSTRQPPSANANSNPNPNPNPNSPSTNTQAIQTDPNPDPEPESEPDALFLDATSPQGGRGGMTSFIFMSVMLYMLSSGGGEDFALRQQYRESLHSLRMQQSNFSAWIWDGGSVNYENTTLGNKTEGTNMNFTLVRCLVDHCV